MLFSLLLLPVFAVLYLRLQQRRRRVAVLYGTLGIVQAPTGQSLGARRHLPPLLFLTGLAILLLALARPQATLSLPRLEGTVILAFDVSGSMAADDLAPTRMEAAKAAALSFVERQPTSVQIGVVVFSDSGFAVQPPTDDPDAIIAAINRMVPQRGTSLGQGILASLSTLFPPQEPTPLVYSELPPTALPTPTPVPTGVYIPSVIVLLTDGENTAPPDPFEAVQLAAERGVRIYPIGIGSAAGTILEVEGFSVHTRLDEETLQQIALITGGEYFNAENEEDLRRIYENLDPELVLKTEEMEVTSVFAGASLLLILIGGTFSLFWLGRIP
jgi:Ca-activated chloride channel family protein